MPPSLVATSSVIIGNVTKEMTSEGILAVINGSFVPSSDIINDATAYRHSKVSDIWLSFQCLSEPFSWVVTDTDTRGTKNGYAFLEVPSNKLVLPSSIPPALCVWKVYDGRLDSPTMATCVPRESVTTISVVGVQTAASLQTDVDTQDRAVRRVAVLEAELRAREEKEKEKERREESVGEENKLCIICMEEEKRVVMVPCGHICVCVKCSKNPAITKCPYCRSHVSQKVQCYF